MEDKAASFSVALWAVYTERDKKRKIRANSKSARHAPLVQLRASVCTAGVFTGRSASGLTRKTLGSRFGENGKQRRVMAAES